MNKLKFMEKNPRFALGMHVHGRDDQALGRITSMDDESFTIEKGVFFPKNFSLRYDDVNEIRGDKIYVNQSVAELREWKSPDYTGWDHVESVNAGEIKPEPVDSFRPRYESLAEESVKVPVYEEELEARKVSRQTGEVRIRKIVHTELKHLTVPLAHEEVRVIHIGAERRGLKDNELTDAFKDKSVSMPIMDEDIEVTKRTVLKEEVQLQKERVIEQRDVSDNIRSEDLEIEGADEKFEKKKKTA